MSTDHANPRRRRILASAPWAAAALGWPSAHAQAPLKTLVIARTNQFKSMDPVRSFEESSSMLQELAYSTLLNFAWLDRPYRMEPDLLDRMPERSADGRRHLIHPRNAVARAQSAAAGRRGIPKG